MITVSITNNDIKNSLKKILKDNNQDMITLLSELIEQSHPASNYFITLVLGGKLPKPPKENFMGFVDIEKFRYSAFYDKLKNSSYNQNGYVEVRVTGFSGYTTYVPLKIMLPGDFGDAQVEIKDFYLDSSGDPYDHEEIPF